MGHTVTVLLIPQIKWKKADCIGWFNPKDMTIGILKRPGTVPEQVFAHELVHAITYVMGHALYEDEEFTDTFSGLLHQVATTAKPRPPRRSRKG